MKLRWILVAVVVVAGYFAVFGGEYSVFDVRRLTREREKEMQKLEATRAEVERLQARADSLEKDPATLERIARERYGLIKAGERLYRFAGDTAAASEAADSAAAPPPAGGGRVAQSPSTPDRQDRTPTRRRP